jgi:endonuclease YncB( thermonuclease family)
MSDSARVLRGTAALAAALVAALSVTAVAPASAAATTYWYGYVTKIADGDTLYVDIAGDAQPPVPVRTIGIQATETLGGPGGGPECHADAAKELLAKLVPVGAEVRLSSYYPSSTAGTDSAGVPRLLRYVDRYNDATGHYDLDVQLDLLNAGLVMSGPERVESARVVAYKVAMQQAMDRGVGMWDPESCGPGPETGAALQMWSHYDADGDDATMNNGEWIHIRNVSESPLSLTGWKLRDAGHSFWQDQTYYTFPAGATIPAYGTITVYPGAGTTSITDGRYYLGVAVNWMANSVDPALGYPGKTVYLLDPDLDFRAWADYPCLTDCTAPPVRISNTHWTTDEYVDIRLDRGVTTPVDLTSLEVTNDGWTKEIMPGTVLNPGETLRIWCQRSGTDSRLTQYWNRTDPILTDTGDTVVLRTARSVTASTYRWGTG